MSEFKRYVAPASSSRLGNGRSRLSKWQEIHIRQTSALSGSDFVWWIRPIRFKLVKIFKIVSIQTQTISIRPWFLYDQKYDCMSWYLERYTLNCPGAAPKPHQAWSLRSYGAHTALLWQASHSPLIQFIQFTKCTSHNLKLGWAPNSTQFATTLYSNFAWVIWWYTAYDYETHYSCICIVFRTYKKPFKVRNHSEKHSIPLQECKTVANHADQKIYTSSVSNGNKQHAEQVTYLLCFCHVLKIV